MEENRNKDKKKKLPLITILVTMLVCCIAFTVLCLTGIIPVKTSLGYIDVKTAALVQKSTEVSDEETLRELLLLKKELAIVVTEDIEIDETFIVRGKKTLYGDATISADVAGEYRTMSIFDVQPGSVLNMNGLILDGDGTADGINVCQDAALNYYSGTIQYMRYGIQTNGKVTLDDVLIQHSTQAGVLASYRSKVYVNGGTYYNANSHLIHVDTNGYVEIHEDADFSVCRGDAVFNAGTLYVYGGTFHDTLARAINTEGELHMEYKGEKKDGYIEMYNIGSIAVRMNAHDDCYISDVHAVNVGTNGVFTTDLRSNGKTTVEHCIFDTCAIVEGNGMSVSRKVEINDVTILNSQGGGINVREYGDVKMDGVTIDGTNGDGISIGSGLEAKNISISNVKGNNLEVITGVEATLSDSVLGKSTRTSVYMRNESTLTLDSVEVQGVIDEGIFNFHVNEGSVLNLKGDTSITGATRVAICLYKNTTLNMEDGKIYGIKGTDNGAGVWVREEGAVFNMKGGSIENNTTTGSSGGVFVADGATFNMYGGKITGNSAQYSGGGVQVQGVMNFKGGTISNNKTETTGGGINVGNNVEKDIYGKLNMTGGTVANNYSVNNGGGISVSGNTTVNISGGTIKGNKSSGIGDGIHDNGNLTISGKAYITGNDIGLNNKSIVLNIKGSSLRKHSASDPLHISPVQSTFTGDIVVKCDSEKAAKKLLKKYVASGNSAFTLTQLENNITVNPNAADIDMTGAETVYVSNFQELKEAVETTETKRIVVVCADIEMETKITVPSGTSVCIRDDGTTRTLSRQSGNTAKFFETWYGTGFILKGTSEGRLVLDGGNADNKAEDYQQLVYVRGTTKIENVAFANNGVADSYTGTFVNQQYGSMTITNSTFKNGLATEGGAIQTRAGAATITDCTFIENTSTNRGGAICNANCEMVIKNCIFKNNQSLTSGGAVYNAENGILKLEGTSKAALFEGNTAQSGLGGGAICVGTGELSVTGYIFKNNVAENSNGGAININSVYSILTIKDSTFESNKNTDDDKSDKLLYYGGAVYTKAATTYVENSVFKNNSTSENGGAIYTLRGTATVKNSTFTSNMALVNGGAIYNAEKGVLILKGTSSETAVFANNTAEGNGGAVAIGTGSIDVKGYTFIGNSGTNGGAIRFNTEAIAASIKNTVFKNNTASVEGGAINSWSTYEDGWKIVNSTFEGNTADANGGALYTRKTELTVENASFINNETNGQGGAIGSYGKALTVKECQFNDNSALGSGGAIYNGNYSVLTAQSSTGDSFESNTSGDKGGAICVGTGEINIIGYTFANNSAEYGGAIRFNTEEIKAAIADSVFKNNTASIEGGAINSWSTYEGGWKIADSTFEGNSADVNGGAIYTRKTELTIENTSFTNNETNGQGGAIGSYGKELVAKDCQFYSNSAVGNGGAIYNGNYSVLTAKSSKGATFESNTSEDKGGAICIGTGELNLTGYTFTNNSAVHGGAIRFNTEEIKATIANSVFKSNTASAEGGAINSYSTYEDGWKVTGSTFEGNTAAVHGGAIYTRNAKASVENSTFNSNETEGQGGAIISYGKALDIINSGFKGNSSGGNGGAIYSGEKGILTLKSENASKIRNNISKADGGAIALGSGELNLEGDYVIEGNQAGASSGAVYIASGVVFNMKGGTLSENTSTYSGGAVQVQGVMHLSGGTISGNTSGTSGGGINVGNNTGKNVYGELYMTGGTIEKNTATGNGGGIAISGGTTVEISGGSITDNATGAVGNGIYDNGNLTISGSIYMGQDEIELNSTKIVLRVKGDSLSAHSLEEPLLISPHKDSTYGTDVVECDDAQAAASLINYIASGNRAYILCLDEEGNIVSVEVDTITSEEMEELTDADTVYVSDFAQLKEAVETTKETRIIILTKDIEMESVITVPQEAIVQIKDNGEMRTLGRYEGNKNSYFKTNYGSGLYLKGTEAGSLVIDGSSSSDATVSSLIAGLGTVKTDSVVFENNETTSVSGNGFFINQEFGLTHVINTTFNNGHAKQGGAIYAQSGETEITNCSFTNNTATASGGAVYNARNNELVLNVQEGYTVSALFEGNISNGEYGGGAICVGTGNITVDGYTFRNNKSVNVSGGAIQLHSANTIAAISNSAFETNKTVDENTEDETIYHAGAIYSCAKLLDVDNTDFTGNETFGDGGAIYVEKGKLDIDAGNYSDNSGKEGGAIKIVEADITTTVANAIFTNNTATSYGGAICNYGKSGFTVTDCTFGGEGTEADQYALGNKAGGNGGAIYHAKGGKITLNDNDASVTALFQNNKSSGNGGAICIGSGTLEINGYEFTGNSAEDGGAIKLNNQNIVAEITDSVFESNNASSEGGAIYNDSTNGTGLTVTNASFTKNHSGGSGGAIFAKRGGTELVSNTEVPKEFDGNTAGSSKSAQYGGAIYADIGTLHISGYHFKNNSAYGAGGAVRLAGSVTNATFTECEFTGNEALSGYGGAISNNSTSTQTDAVTITDTKFASNTAKYGGAIHNRQSELKLVGTKDVGAEGATAIFDGNTATVTGGAIYMMAGTLNVTKYEFVSNISASFGGAICHPDDQVNNAVTMNVSSCKFDSNTATSGQGGAFYHNKKDVVDISDTEFTNNEATAGHGGALCSEGGTLTVTNCDFTGNTAGGSGGAYRIAATGHATFTNGTFSSNSASGAGGAVQFNTGTLVITNYTFTGNSVNGASNAINTNNRGDVHYTKLVNCIIETSDITGKGVK